MPGYLQVSSGTPYLCCPSDQQSSPSHCCLGACLALRGWLCGPCGCRPASSGCCCGPIATDQQFVLQTAPSTSVKGVSATGGSSPLLFYESLSQGRDPPSTWAIPSPSLGVWAPVGNRVPPVFRVPPTQAPVHLSWVQLLSCPSCPDPDGLAEPPRLMGGHPYPGYVGSSPIYGGGPYFHGGLHSQYQGFSLPSLSSTADQWHTLNFTGELPQAVPLFIHGPSTPHPFHGGSPHAPALVASMLASAAPPLHPLMHEDLSGNTASDLTMSFLPTISAIVAPLVVPSAVVSPAVQVLPSVLVPPPPVVNVDLEASTIVPPSPALAPTIHPAKPFKLPAIPDAKAFLNLSSTLQYYLCCLKFSTLCLDNALITDS
jgi:hypothetical protein